MFWKSLQVSGDIFIKHSTILSTYLLNYSMFKLVINLNFILIKQYGFIGLTVLKQ